MRWFAFAAITIAILSNAGIVAADNPSEALAHINAYRAEAGLKPLRMEARLAVMSRNHAQDMMQRQYFETRAPKGPSLETRLRTAGYAYRQASVQISIGYQNGRAVADSWLRRGDSRRVLLSNAMSEIGIGYARRGTGSLDHYWVITLAEPTRPGRRKLAPRYFETGQPVSCPASLEATGTERTPQSLRPASFG